jgi:hypothetical protein
MIKSLLADPKEYHNPGWAAIKMFGFIRTNEIFSPR